MLYDSASSELREGQDAKIGERKDVKYTHRESRIHFGC